MPPQPSGLPLELPTLADQLRHLGYATHAIGKWHLGFYKKEYTPIYRGFDTFFGKLWKDNKLIVLQFYSHDANILVFTRENILPFTEALILSLVSYGKIIN